MEKTPVVIDCDDDPFVPDGWGVEEHIKGGQLEWDSKKVILHLSDGQKRGRTISGFTVRKQLSGSQVLNANVLDYLLANQHLIPGEWKDKHPLFWGTIYRKSSHLCVRCLYWANGTWFWGFQSLNMETGFYTPAAMIAS